MLKQAPLPAVIKRDSAQGTPQQDLRHLTTAARELYDLKVRERGLVETIDRPDSLVMAIDEQMNVLFGNKTFWQRFPGARDFGSLVRQSDAAEVKKALQSACAGETLSAEIDLAENGGIFRAYRFTLAPALADRRSTVAIVIGEDLTGLKRSRRDLESLLYIIRSAGESRDEPQLLKDTLNGIKERLLPYTHAVVFIDGDRIAYKTPGMSPENIEDAKQLAVRSMAGMETVSAHSADQEHSIAVPIISDEKPLGSIVLTLKVPAMATDAENIEIVADEVSTVLKSLRLDREKTEFVNTLLAVNRVSSVLNETRDESRMLERSISSTMETLGFDMGCVYLKECGSEMAMKVHKNMPESLYSMCLSGKFKSLFDRALQERRVVYITRDTPEFAELDEEIKANGVSTILVLPIVAGEEIVGLLNMGSRAYKPYSRMSLDNIASIGLQLGLALERTRLATELDGQAGKHLT
jgi:GAF domain-containing protein